jgi:hypothetical protein
VRGSTRVASAPEQVASAPEPAPAPVAPAPVAVEVLDSERLPAGIEELEHVDDAGQVHKFWKVIATAGVFPTLDEAVEAQKA